MPKSNPLTLGAQYRLGNYKTAYKPYTALRQLAYGIPIVAIVVIFSYLVLNKIPLFMWSFIVLTLLGPFLGLVLPSLFKRKHRVFFYDHGFIYVEGRSQKIIKWQDIKRVWCYKSGSAGEGENTYLNVDCANGIKITVGEDYWDIEKLKKAIEREMTYYHSP